MLNDGSTVLQVSLLSDAASPSASTSSRFAKASALYRSALYRSALYRSGRYFPLRSEPEQHKGWAATAMKRGGGGGGVLTEVGPAGLLGRGAPQCSQRGRL